MPDSKPEASEDTIEPMSAHQTSQPQMGALTVSIRLPPFAKNNPSLWFMQLEANFVVNQISSDSKKYNYVIATISNEVLEQVSDLVLNPPQAQQYNAIKARILERYADSEQQRLRKLLVNTVLGDKRPSHLLREMRTLAGCSISNDVIKSLWVQQLPRQMQAILSVSDGDLEKLAQLADKISEVHEGSQTVQTIENDRLAQVEQQLAEVVSTLNKFAMNNTRRNPVRSTQHSSRSRSTSAKSNTTNVKFCWYHRRFKQHAKRCNQPCSFSSEN